MTLPTQHPDVELRSYLLNDAAALATIANNDKIWLNLRDAFPHPYTLEDGERFITMCQEHQPNTVLGIFYQNRLVGSVGLHLQQDVYSHSAELGYFIGEPYWNKGIASVVVERILQFGWEELKLQRIFASVFAHNLASARILEKNGFQREGIRIKGIFKNNEYLDEYLFGILNPDVS